MENLQPLPSSGSKKSSKKVTKKATKKVESPEDKQARAEAMLKQDMANASQPDFNRRVKGTEEVWHDLFRLDVAEPRKNISFQEGKEFALWEKMPHKHFFHSVDSDGKKQIYATPALGHTHKVEVVGADEDGKPILEVGPAVVVLKNKEYKLNEDKMDVHVHEAAYIKSEKVKKRTYSEEFLKHQSEIEKDMVAASRAPSGVR